MKHIDNRKKMIDNHLIARGISTEKIINAFFNVPRHLFVPNEFKHYSYADTPLSIGNSQTISQPYIVAQMLELLEIEDKDIVLEIGTGSGYQTAILAEICQEVYTIERIAELGKKARKQLDKMNYTNIHYLIGDGTLGWTKSNVKFDKIIVSAASPQVPKSLLMQLANYGKIIIPCGSRNMQELELITKIENKLHHSFYGSCTFVPLIGEEGWK